MIVRHLHYVRVPRFEDNNPRYSLYHAVVLIMTRDRQRKRSTRLRSILPPVATFTCRSLARKHQQQWQGLNGGRKSPLFNLDAFTATAVASARRNVQWTSNFEFDSCGGATHPVINDAAGATMSSDGVIPPSQSGAWHADPGVYLSGQVNREAFLPIRNALLDCDGGLDDVVQSSVVLGVFTSSDCDCFISALVMTQCLKNVHHNKPFILQDIRPFNKHLCQARFSSKPQVGENGGYRIPCGASVMRSGRLRIQYECIQAAQIGQYIREQEWEKALAEEGDSAKAATAHVCQWRRQLEFLGLASACHLGLGSRQYCSAITAGFYHPDWLFICPNSGLPRDVTSVHECAALYCKASQKEQQVLFDRATAVPCSKVCERLQNDFASLTTFLQHIRMKENTGKSITIFTGSGLSSIVWLANNMTPGERQRVTRMGHMILTTDPSQSILKTLDGMGVSYNEAVDPDSAKECFFDKRHPGGLEQAGCSHQPVRSPVGSIPLQAWFPNAAIYLWNTMSSKGCLEQDI